MSQQGASLGCACWRQSTGTGYCPVLSTSALYKKSRGIRTMRNQGIQLPGMQEEMSQKEQNWPSRALLAEPLETEPSLEKMLQHGSAAKGSGKGLGQLWQVFLHWPLPQT